MAINYNAPIEVRDSRNGSWFWIHTHVWKDKRLSKADKVVYGTLAAYVNSSSQTAFPSITKISLDSDTSERHTYRSLKNLERLEYVGVRRKIGKPNRYTLLKTTPDMMSPLTNRQQGGDKEMVLTRINNKNNTLSKDNGSANLKSIADVLKEKKIDIRSNEDKRISQGWQYYALEVAKISGVGNNARDRLFQAFKVRNWGHRQLKKAEEVVNHHIYKNLSNDDQKVRYLIGALKI